MHVKRNTLLKFNFYKTPLSDLTSVLVLCYNNVMECRAYIHPNPDKRAILDSVSNFIDATSKSLRAGTVRNTKFTVELRTDVFKVLFAGKGEVASNGRGHLYQQTSTVDISLLVGINAGRDWEMAVKWFSPFRCIHMSNSPPFCYFLDGTISPVVKNRLFSEVVVS